MKPKLLLIKDRDRCGRRRDVDGKLISRQNAFEKGVNAFCPGHLNDARAVAVLHPKRSRKCKSQYPGLYDSIKTMLKRINHSVETAASNAMDAFFESEKTGRTHAESEPLRASYQDSHGKSDFIFTQHDHQLSGKSKKGRPLISKFVSCKYTLDSRLL